jgi:rsbT co-antagonist protein RsbR
MASNATITAGGILRANYRQVLERWLAEQRSAGAARPDLISDADLEAQCGEVLSVLARALEAGSADASTTAYDGIRATLRSIALTRARLGFSPADTALFVFSLKQPMFEPMQQLDGETRAQTIAELTELIDRLGLFTIEVYQQGREEVILRQQQEMLELSTPVVKLWDGVLALPLIGTLDSERTQVVMETLLQSLVDTGSTIAIIDITGVPMVDTKVAQHLIQTVSAARLMGADCIISGIRPQIAQTIIHLGIELPDVATKATLADAFALALARVGQAVGPAAPPRG